jgi:hypothetical protein
VRTRWHRRNDKESTTMLTLTFLLAVVLYLGGIALDIL